MKFCSIVLELIKVGFAFWNYFCMYIVFVGNEVNHYNFVLFTPVIVKHQNINWNICMFPLQNTEVFQNLPEKVGQLSVDFPISKHVSVSKLQFCNTELVLKHVSVESSHICLWMFWNTSMFQKQVNIS